MKKKKLEKWVASVMAGRLRQKEQSNLKIPKDMENYFDATVMAFVMVHTAPNKKAKEAAQSMANKSGVLLSVQLLKQAGEEADRQLGAMN